ncbi:hypothetical protein NBCG_05082 [Nocardioidaceae bacterium Broad-1]|nr:hypothetical protein NBCG_05082 [Nocardioidaceae bacterium Broad-1]
MGDEFRQLRLLVPATTLAAVGAGIEWFAAAALTFPQGY